MSSVQDIMECPQCKGIYSTDFNCRTQEEYRHCSRCGRTEKWMLVRDGEGKPVLDDEGHVKTGSSASRVKVVAELLENGKEDKVIVYKYKAKKNEHVKQGHRQPYSKLKVVSIG